MARSRGLGDVYKRQGVVRQARTDANVNAGVIARAIEVATRCDTLRTERAGAQARLDQARASAATAVTVREVGAEQVDGAQAASSWIDEWRPFGISLGLSIIAIFAFWIGTKLGEARALYVEPEKPATPAPEPAPAATEPPAGTQAPGDGDGLDGLVLPPLPDLRGLEDPDFDRLGPMDENGRRLRRVAGHFRPEPAPKVGKASDQRRAPEPPAPSEPASAAAGDDGNVDFGDLLDGLANEPAPAPQTEPAK
jgi:hypothetical protein